MIRILNRLTSRMVGTRTDQETSRILWHNIFSVLYCGGHDVWLKKSLTESRTRHLELSSSQWTSVKVNTEDRRKHEETKNASWGGIPGHPSYRMSFDVQESGADFHHFPRGVRMGHTTLRGFVRRRGRSSSGNVIQGEISVGAFVVVGAISLEEWVQIYWIIGVALKMSSAVRCCVRGSERNGARYRSGEVSAEPI